MIRAKDVEEFAKGEAFKCQAWQWKKKELYQEIIKRLRAYDGICHDLKQLIATLSNVVD